MGRVGVVLKYVYAILSGPAVFALFAVLGYVLVDWLANSRIMGWQHGDPTGLLVWAGISLLGVIAGIVTIIWVWP